MKRKEASIWLYTGYICNLGQLKRVLYNANGITKMSASRLDLSDVKLITWEFQYTYLCVIVYRKAE